MRNRLAVTAAVGVMATLAMLTLSPSAVVAQTSETQTPQGTANLPLPSIGLPLPSIGLPHPAMGLPPVETRKTEPSPRDRTGDGRTNNGQANAGGTRDGGRRGRQGRPIVVYPPLIYVPPAIAPAAAGTSVGAPKPTVSAASDGMGRLVVDITPAATAQLYVDGYYVGMPADYPEGIEMTAGPHTFEVRVPGEEPVSTSLQIAAGRAITYRTALDTADGKTAGRAVARTTSPAVAPPPAATPAASEPVSRTPFYLIPGCYLGNIPPDRDNVPAGCDISQVRTIKP